VPTRYKMHLLFDCLAQKIQKRKIMKLDSLMSTQKDVFSSKSYPTIIDGSTCFKGDLELGANARIDGNFVGNLVAQGEDTQVTLVIGRQGSIHGDIRCHSIQISGTVHGNVQAKLVELRNGGVIEGDVLYDDIELHQGGSILGALKRTQAAPSKR